MNMRPTLATLGLLMSLSVFASPKRDIIENHYIVTLNQGTIAKSIIQAYGLTPKYLYSKAMHGFAANIPDDVLAQMKKDDRIQDIEQDMVVHAIEDHEVTDDRTTTWGIDRIDQRELPLDGSYTYNSNGSGVTAYVIDTGIRIDHEEFAGRASYGFDALGGTGNDCHGHGTHVAGTIGGTTYGVAKNVKLVAVRVLDCNGSGSSASVLAGIDWVMKNRSLPATANMSLGLNGVSDAIETAVKNMIAANVATAIAAGNSSTDACNFTPARVPEAMTVGATNISDARSSFSNYGNCVDWFAPGENIESSWNTGTTDVRTLSGTSMAAPHTAGVAALYLQNHPAATPDQVRDALFSFTSKSVVTSSNTVNNHLLYSYEKVATPPADSELPTVALTSPANNTSYMRMATVHMQATAKDNVGVNFVKFYVNNSVVCTDSTAPYSCSWRMPVFANPSYTLKAQAFDAAGNVGTSQTVTIRRSFK